VSKGDKRRPGTGKYEENYEKIFGKKRKERPNNASSHRKKKIQKNG